MLVPLFAFAQFLSAFLMFSVEPMIAKMVLPVLGGAPMVWNTCVVFFQLALLGGYTLAYLATGRFAPRLYAAIYAGLLALSLLTLPFTLRMLGGPPLNRVPIPWLLSVLAWSIGLPFLALSMSTSILQRLLSGTHVRAARDPYFLYAASNAGSLTALLTYPSIVEPMLRLTEQRLLWTAGYAVFTVFALLCAVVATARTRNGGRIERAASDVDTVGCESESALPWPRRVKWVALSCIPSSLMLGVTTYLSTDIAAVPLFWIVPLALYLLTLIVAFSSRGNSARALATRWMPLLLVALVLLLSTRTGGALWFIIPLHLLVFAMLALGCHAELAADRPPPARLAEFYCWLAVGGVLGGILNTIIAPVLFTSIVEYQLVMVAGCVALLRSQSTVPILRPKPADYWMPIALGFAAALLMVLLGHFDANPQVTLAAVGPLGLICFSQKRRPLRFAAMLGAMMLAGAWGVDAYGRVLFADRTFFGVYRVSLEGSGRLRSMYHGTTLHGMQRVGGPDRDEPLTYYRRTGPFDEAWSRLPNARGATDVAVVGLGIGTLATYAQPDQRWTFYEIDPAVERIARSEEYFTFLHDCGAKCRVVVGDARRSLAAARGASYGLIVLDAFSSDAIPVHLMTNEALSLYLSHLAPHGILMFHISSRHLQLGPVLGRLARNRGLTALERVEALPESEFSSGLCPSDWVVMGRDLPDLGVLTTDRKWRAPAVASSTPLWTDDFSDLIGVIHAQ